MSRTRVAVLGAGIIGLTSAVRVIETVPGLEVTLMSEDFTPNTTGDGSAGFICPYLIGDQLPAETLARWFDDSWNFFLEHYLSTDGGERGVGLLAVYSFFNLPEEEHNFRHRKYLPDYRSLTQKELQLCAVKYRKGCSATSLFVECQLFLPYLMDRFRRCGGIIMKRRVNRLLELADEFDVVINCTGLGAAHIVPDSSVIPIRGQVIRVKAPWVKCMIETEAQYIIPNSEFVTLGGTHQENDWNTRVSPDDSQRIWEECCKLLPSLQKAEVLKEWVGLRPYRPCPRIERETLVNVDGKRLEVVHNYGHGGSGVTLSWGCAADVVNLLRAAIGRADSKL